MKKIGLFILLMCHLIVDAQPLAKPSAVQYKWQEQGRIMFVHFGVATWLGQEYDETGEFDISRINPTKLDTDQWCRVAKSWGAKEIIFVAKHAGSFCWWPTYTTEYCVRNIPWKNGKGDLIKDIAESCKKAGLNLGIYIYPGDIKWGAGLGSGGITKDPSKQEEYNKIFRQQLTEVLTNYGQMLEVWFDGSCKVPVSDILQKYAAKAVIFQGSDATIRWPGTESGILHYPVWNTVNSKVLKSGVATQYDDDPNGDAWAPLEADVTLYNHNWFWSAKNEAKRRSVNELMEIYYNSVGNGGTLLLNSSPDTTGLIPEGDVKRYAEFGAEINRRFQKPVAEVSNKKAKEVELTFPQANLINHIVLKEKYEEGHRIRKFEVWGLTKDKWQKIGEGSSVGVNKIIFFEDIKVSKIKFKITECVGVPLIRSISAFYVKGFEMPPSVKEAKEYTILQEWDTKNFVNGKGEMRVDLSSFITAPGQYEVSFTNAVSVTGMWVEKAQIIFDNDPNTLQEFIQRKSNENIFYINRTGQIDKNTSSILKAEMSSDNSSFQNKGFIKIRKR
ncbi:MULTISPECIES: alpha-L-fucosidase [Emticicia]|uniref:alpha-L-fucosidase n=1 Tax=Emticicia TaxID=312278 RepID=UPI0007D8C654|nr:MULTISPECIES: alpha-L-fucosidase [Emticicia]